MALVPTIKTLDDARRAIQKLAGNKLGPNASPTFYGLTLTTPLLVPSGGTGLATITDHGLLLGSGTGAITPLAEATDGQIPIGDTDGDPILATITGTANRVTVSNAAGSITLTGPQDIDPAADVTFATVNTGQGANELYDMNQNVTMLSNVNFASVGLFDFTDEYYLNLITEIGKLGASDKNLKFDVNDASRIITFLGDPTLADWFDQSVKTTAKPTFGSTVATNFLMGTDVAVDDDGAVNIMIGYEAGRNNDHVAGETGNQNVYIGYQSGYGATGVTKNTGSSNVGIGYRTLYKNTSGSYNFALGYVSLDANTSGTGHVSIGYAALSQLTTGHNNVAIGRSSLTALGTNSSNNTAIGTYTGLINTTGSRNIFIGYRAGRYQTGSDILLIQSQTNAASAADELANSIIYGVMAAAPANQTLRINANTLVTDKIAFTQTDLNEYIDSLNDGYMDYGATTAHRINVGGAYKYTLPVADGNADEIVKTDGSGNLSFVRMPKAIYAELSDSADQTFAVAGTHYSITFDTNDEIAGITHSTSVDPENITIVTTGVYTIFAQPQVAAAAGGAGTFHMWLQKDTGGGFADIANTNIELSLASAKEDVIPLATTFMLSAGDKIRLRVNVSDNGIKLDAQAAIVGPPTEPAIPSIIFTMFMIGT